ncbi:endothelin-converting enzyme 1-like [Amblyomma americanum]
MVRLNLDLLNLAGSRTVDSVNAVARLSLDVGFPVMFEFKLFDEYFVEGKRAMQFKICDSRTAWEKKREKLRSPVRVRGYISDQLLYYPGYDPENQKHKELTNATYGYDEAFVAILKTDRYITEPFYTRAIQDMGLRTTPQITAAQWIDAVSKYTNGTYEGPDVIQFQQSVLQALAGLLRSPLWGPDGFRAMLAWGLFDGLLDYALSPKVVFGKEKEVACYHHVLEVMEFAATSRYLRSVVSSRARNRAEGMFLTAKDTVRGVLDLYDGFQETERVFVQRIVHFMNPLVSSPQQRLDQIFVNKFFAGFPDMSPTGRFLDAWFKALSGRARLKWTDQTHVLFNTSRAAPFYLKRNHSLVIPAGALLPISLYGDGHPALTLGSLGDALVHEIMKAYDIKGPYQCYSDRTRRRYTELVECLAQQRQQAGLPGRPNGSQLIDLENVADLAGASLLDKLFWQLHDDERSWTLPNLNLTAEQLVYVGRCMTKCNFNDFAQTETLEGSRARCNIPAMNTPQFSRAFNCGPTARMNPELKCTHWL